jgi:hypothetical protein
VLKPEENHPLHQVIQISRAKGSGPPGKRGGVIASPHKVDVGRGINLAATQKKGVDSSSGRKVEELNAAVRHGVMPSRAEN